MKKKRKEKEKETRAMVDHDDKTMNKWWMGGKREGGARETDGQQRTGQGAKHKKARREGTQKCIKGNTILPSTLSLFVSPIASEIGPFLVSAYQKCENQCVGTSYHVEHGQVLDGCGSYPLHPIR